MTTRDKIIHIAQQHFIQHGIERTQMTDIAGAVGIHRRTLYRHFPTKDVLAFTVEMNVMAQLAQHMAQAAHGISSGVNGYVKVQQYFHQVDLAPVQAQIRFTAEFDRYFQDAYPSKDLEDDFIDSLHPQSDPLYTYITEGQQDGSIRDDLPTLHLYQLISQSFLALFQRLVLRANHLQYEHCANMDFDQLYRDVILRGIRPLSHPNE